MEELLTAAESSGEFDGLSMLGHVCSRLRKGERVLAAWEGAVEEDGRDAGLTKADRELLRGFGSQLGRTDVEGQIANCRQYGNLIHVVIGLQINLRRLRDRNILRRIKIFTASWYSMGMGKRQLK